AAAQLCRGAGARSRLSRELGEEEQQEARLVHNGRRRISCGQDEDEAISANVGEWTTEFSAQELEQGRRRMEPLLCARHQRRASPLGQWRRSLRRQWHRA